MKSALFAVVATLVLAQSALGGDPLLQLNPPASPDEVAMYQEIQNDSGEVQKFLATRKFVRAYASNPKAKMPQEFDFRYTIDVVEQMKMYKIAIMQGMSKVLG